MNRDSVLGDVILQTCSGTLRGNNIGNNSGFYITPHPELHSDAEPREAS